MWIPPGLFHIPKILSKNRESDERCYASLILEHFNLDVLIYHNKNNWNSCKKEHKSSSFSRPALNLFTEWDGGGSKNGDFRSDTLLHGRVKQSLRYAIQSDEGLICPFHRRVTVMRDIMMRWNVITKYSSVIRNDMAL